MAMMDYWDEIAQETGLKPISERQLRDCIKQICHHPRKPNDRVISIDKVMNQAKGPIWHKKQKNKGFEPDLLPGLDKEATWCTDHAHGWIFDHGGFALTSHRYPAWGCFMWMPNSGNEAKRMWHETVFLKDYVDYVSMDSKTDSYPLYREFKRQEE